MGTLRNSQRMLLPALPRVIPNVLGNPSLLDREEVPEELQHAFHDGPRRGVGKFLANRHNSRFLALESWWRTPRQWDQLWHVVRPGPRPQPDLFIYRDTHISLTPSLAFESLPEANVIHLYRDGRDVANSLVESYNALADEALTEMTSIDVRLGRSHDHRRIPWWVEEGAESEFLDASQFGRSIWFWAFVTERCESYFSSLSERESDRLLNVRYEDFMRDPQLWGWRICDHLDKEPTAAFRRTLNQARTTAIGKHKQRPREEIEEGTQIAGMMLEELGYR